MPDGQISPRRGPNPSAEGGQGRRGELRLSFLEKRSKNAERQVCGPVIKPAHFPNFILPGPDVRRTENKNAAQWLKGRTYSGGA